MEPYRLSLLHIAGGPYRELVDAYTKLDARKYFDGLNKAEGAAGPIDGNNDLNDIVIRIKRFIWLAAGPRAREAWEALQN